MGSKRPSTARASTLLYYNLPSHADELQRQAAAARLVQLASVQLQEPPRQSRAGTARLCAPRKRRDGMMMTPPQAAEAPTRKAMVTYLDGGRWYGASER